MKKRKALDEAKERTICARSELQLIEAKTSEEQQLLAMLRSIASDDLDAALALAARLAGAHLEVVAQHLKVVLQLPQQRLARGREVAEDEEVEEFELPPVRVYFDDAKKKRKGAKKRD